MNVTNYFPQTLLKGGTMGYNITETKANTMFMMMITSEAREIQSVQ
jgi:hypothetical protein